MKSWTIELAVGALQDVEDVFDSWGVIDMLE